MDVNSEAYTQKKYENILYLVIRVLCGTLSYTLMVFAVMNVPVFVFTIIVNTAPFFVAIFGWLISKEKICFIEFIFMFGSFAGITYVGL